MKDTIAILGGALVCLALVVLWLVASHPGYDMRCGVAGFSPSCATSGGQ